MNSILSNLAPYAIKESRGRQHHEDPDGDPRPDFERDKDRVLHSRAFRRLDKKTQVFASGSGDHYRTRLTHTLEVTQIGRDLARRLKLNEDLCEVIALAHDLGHPPFGHAGEDALNEMMEEYGSHFEHNEQSRRVVEFLEKTYPNFHGLNLSFEVLEGMAKHQSAYDQAGRKFETAAHLEAQVVNLADEIAYSNHDMDDGLRSGLIGLTELKKLELWREGEAAVLAKYGKIDDEDILISRVVSSVIAIMIRDLCIQTEKNLDENQIQTIEDVQKYQGLLVEFSKNMKLKTGELRYYLYNNFYLHPVILEKNEEGKNMIRKLFHHYMKYPEKMPWEDKSLEAVKDYIAGMTDGFLLNEYNKI